MYFSGVTTCAKNFTGDNRGIALALPIAAFGLSSLWEAQLVSRLFYNDDMGGIEVGKAFVFFAGLLSTVGVMGGVGLTIVPEEKSPLQVCGEGFIGETTSLLGGDSGLYGTNTTSEPVMDSRGLLNAKTREFLCDKTMWWFAAGVFMVTGPGESFINNVCANSIPQ